MEQIDYGPLLPRELPAGLVQWALEQKLFQKEYLIYKAGRVYEPLENRMRPAVEVVCTHCGGAFHAEKVEAGGCSACYAPAPFGWHHQGMSEPVISGSLTLCPLCGCEVKVVHVGNIPRGIELGKFITTMSRLPVEGRKDRFVLTEWLVTRRIEKTGESRYTADPYSAWVVEEKKVVRLMGYLTTMGGSISLFHRLVQRKTFCDVYGAASICCPWDKSLLEGTTAENCKLDLYQDAGGKRLVSYLTLWRKRPTVENLLVQGCGRLLVELIDREKDSGTGRGGIPKLPDVNWKEKRPAQMLGLNKEEFRYMRQMRWSVEDLERYRLVKKAGLPVKLPEDMKLLRNKPAYEINRILEEGPQRDFWRILRYLKKQKMTWGILQDYWHMAHRLHRDLNDSLVRWPRNLKTAHDQVMEEQQARVNAELNAMFLERAAELEPLSFELDGLLIRPCQTEAELIREGKYLHHCVATYAKSHVEGKTAILFIRQMEEPGKPFFTLEFDENAKKVRQNRGLRNCVRTPEVEAFEAAWLAWVRAGAPRGRDGEPVRAGKRNRKGAAA